MSQRMREGHAAVLRRHLVSDQTLEPARGARAGHFVLGERREVDDARTLAHAPAFVADVLKVVGAAEAPLIAPLDAGRREPVGALPSVALSPYCTHAVELVVDRARLHGPRVGALLVGKVNGEDVAIRFLVLRDGVALAGVRAEAARVHGEHVDARLALDDPFGELPPAAPGRGD